MKKYHILLLINLVILITSCSDQKRVSKPDQFIKEDKMVDILTDLYLAEGLLNIPEVRKAFEMKDSTESYIEVIGNHGFTKPVFDLNIEYYFLSKPKKFESIYNEVIVNLSKFEDDIVQEREEENISTRNLWIGRTTYRLPDDGTANPVDFSFPTEGAGLYRIRARSTIFEDDQSLDLATTVYFWYDNGTEEGVTEAWDRHIYEKSGKTVVITLEKSLTDTKFTHIKGKLLDHTPQSQHWEMHSSLNSINVTFIPLEEDQDTRAER